jgi:hypothetical protein
MNVNVQINSKKIITPTLTSVRIAMPPPSMAIGIFLPLDQQLYTPVAGCDDKCVSIN